MEIVSLRSTCSNEKSKANFFDFLIREKKNQIFTRNKQKNTRIRDIRVVNLEQESTFEGFES